MSRERTEHRSKIHKSPSGKSVFLPQSVYKQVEWYYKSRQIEYLPGWPFFGTILSTVLGRKHLFLELDRAHRAFPNEKYVGFIEGSMPIILIRDPELIKLITVRDFDHFTDHKRIVTEHVDPLFGSSLFLMKGEKWRHMRSILSPAFTGSKMKHMMQFMVDISKNIVEYLKEHNKEDTNVDDLIRRYTTDVIASTSFGLEVNSLKDRDNEFYKTGQAVLTFDFRQIVVFILDDTFPSLTKMLGLKLHPKKVYTFFENIIKNAMEYRKTHNVSRPDMLQLLMEAPIEWTSQQLCAQAFLFFAAGFETSASSMVLTIHELALNPDIQERLYQEIKTFKETSQLNPGDVVYNSCNSLHLDPQYWPDPLKFDPDRWSDENKHNITPFTYQPFGLGPRNCIGARFVTMEAKILLYNLVLNFKILRCQKTTDPIELIHYGFHTKALSGTWAKFQKRE